MLLPEILQMTTTFLSAEQMTAGYKFDQGCRIIDMQETEIIGGANYNRKIYDNESGRFADLKMSKKKLYYYDFREVCIG